eukprot:g5771.t1
MALTSDEVNFMVYRYLQESGFEHSAFTFAYESLVAKSNINDSDVPAGTLVSFVQKGLQYCELEAHINADGSERICSEPFRLLTKHQCKPDVNKMQSKSDSHTSPRQLIQVKIQPDEVSILVGHSGEVFVCAWNPVQDILASGAADSTVKLWIVPKGSSGMPAGHVCSKQSATLADGNKKGKSSGGKVGSKKGRGSSKRDKMDVDEGNGGNSDNADNENKRKAEETSNDVTGLDWSPDGRFLATGSFDGIARLWQGEKLVHSFIDAKGSPIFALRFSPSGTYLASGSVNNSVVVYEVRTGQVKQQFKLHRAPVLDLSWRDDEVFASCSTDKSVLVCKIGERKPLLTLSGHDDEVNNVKWSPDGEFLASCSDDKTARVWSVKRGLEHGEDQACVHVLKGHSKEVYCLRWCPAEVENSDLVKKEGKKGKGGRRNSSFKSVLATGSFDSCVKLWDAGSGLCLHTLSKHSFPVYSVAFSPDGKFIASGSFDKHVHIWYVADGTLAQSYRAGGGVFEVTWNASGDKVAICLSNHTLCIMDVVEDKNSLL